MFKRNWLQEALELAEGKPGKVKKEHLRAVIDTYSEATRKLQHMQFLVNKLMENVQKQREEMGLPKLPPLPAFLKHDGEMVQK